MSWSTQAMGKAPAAAAHIEQEFSVMGKCVEPEESIKQKARELIAASLAGCHESKFVQVSASGSQSTEYDRTGKPTERISNSLSIKIEVPYGHVE